MKKLGICGLDCSSCEAFIATEKNDDELRRKTAREWTEKYNERGDPLVKPEEINCRGCLSDGPASPDSASWASQGGPLYAHCFQCEIRKCGLEKGIKNCGECREYRCKKLANRQETMPGAKENCDAVKTGEV